MICFNRNRVKARIDRKKTNDDQITFQVPTIDKQKNHRIKRNNREKREAAAHTLQAAEKTFLPGPVPQGTFYQVTPRLTH